MAGKFIELKDAAEQLGITPEKLQEMRESGEIHGYKDGVSWKFKVSEIERIAGELAVGGDAKSDASASDSASLSGEDFEALLNVDADSEDELDSSSILISEDPDDGEQSSSSTVIGKNGEPKGKDSDLKLADEPAGDDDSELTLVPEEGEGSDVKVVADGSQPSDASDFDLKLADSEDLSDELALSDDLDFESDDALVLGEDSDLSLADDAVLDDSAGSDVPVGGSDSGIGLASPSDSGLSLEEDASSGALELPEDDDMIALDDDMVASPDDATQLQQDEEFLLSPSDEMLGDESSDSGSQVIALDDSGAFESDSDVAMDEAEPMLVPEEAEGLDVQLEPMDGAVAMASSAFAATAAEAPEAPYTAWNIMALLFVVILLSVTGMLMADIVRNMWAWNGDSSITSGLANTIIEALGM